MAPYPGRVAVWPFGAAADDIERAVLVGIRSVEALFHDRKILVQRQRAITIRIGGREFLRR